LKYSLVMNGSFVSSVIHFDVVVIQYCGTGKEVQKRFIFRVQQGCWHCRVVGTMPHFAAVKMFLYEKY
jgi:hypothetical protein